MLQEIIINVQFKMGKDLCIMSVIGKDLFIDW